MPAGRPTLHLHIGRNKAGSTTLQRYFMDHAAPLRGMGMEYVLFAQPSPAGSLVPSFSTHRDIADFARARHGRPVLVSHEGLCCFSLEMTRIMANDLANIDTSIIFYVRPYRDWVVSSYNFDIRTGHDGRDFDRYLEAIAASISFWPMLEIWGETLGWDKVRVRSLHPADLVGGDLLNDCLSALGLPASRGPGARANTSPSWWAIELFRLITELSAGGEAAAGWSKPGLAIAQIVHFLLDLCAGLCGAVCPPARYLTRAQGLALAASFNSDLDRLAAKSGTRLHPDRAGDFPERVFLPAAAHVPPHILRMIRRHALAPLAAARLHPEAAAFVDSAQFRTLCGV